MLRPDAITVQELANRMAERAADVIKHGVVLYNNKSSYRRRAAELVLVNYAVVGTESDVKPVCKLT